MPESDDPRWPLHVISKHPSFAPLIKQTLSASQDRRLISRLTFPNPNSAPRQLQPCVFILDVWSLGDQIIGACRLLRVRHPGSKFVALVAPGENDHDEALRLLFAGFDGTVKAADNWCDELADAIEVILGGRLWFPREIISEYVKHTNLLLDNHLSKSLTARENQVLQLVVRRLSNKEIGGALGISERTVRFHVSKVFTKLRIENRAVLFKTINVTSMAHYAS
ncbi:MAG: helix-turn-helix transcriptional regulator [Terriglobia bacterium]